MHSHSHDDTCDHKHTHDESCHHCHDDHEHDHEHAHDHCPEPHSGKKGILLTAFGCAVTETHSLYETFENEVRALYPDMCVRWAFTANRIRNKLRGKGIACMSVAEALSQMVDDGFSHVTIQSLHTLPGVEYDWTVQQAQAMCHPRKGLTEIHIGTPLLHSMKDLEETAKAVAEYIPSEREEKDGVILIGHGTYHNGHTFYPALEGLISRTLSNIVVGTLMDKEGPAQLGKHFRDKGIKRVFLLPFMCVPGHHVQVDLFGPKTNSWKSILSSMGIDVVEVHTGSLAHSQFRQIWLNHLAEAITANTASTSVPEKADF